MPRSQPRLLSQGAAKAQRDHGARIVALINLYDGAHGESPHPCNTVHTLIVSTIGATSCTRTTRAPFKQAASEETAEAVARSTTDRPVILPRKPLRDVPIKIA